MLWKGLVRSVLEYGCEIWGEGAFSDLEKIQIEMGRKILRCNSTLTKCDSGEVEDETHFMLFCPAYKELRENMWKELERFGNEVVLGELGWETMKARRDEMRLRYWAKI